METQHMRTSCSAVKYNLVRFLDRLYFNTTQTVRKRTSSSKRNCRGSAAFALMLILFSTHVKGSTAVHISLFMPGESGLETNAAGKHRDKTGYAKQPRVAQRAAAGGMQTAGRGDRSEASRAHVAGHNIDGARLKINCSLKYAWSSSRL